MNKERAAEFGNTGAPTPTLTFIGIDTFSHARNSPLTRAECKEKED